MVQQGGLTSQVPVFEKNQTGVRICVRKLLEPTIEIELVGEVVGVLDQIGESLD